MDKVDSLIEDVVGVLPSGFRPPLRFVHHSGEWCVDDSTRDTFSAIAVPKSVAVDIACAWVYRCFSSHPDSVAMPIRQYTGLWTRSQYGDTFPDEGEWATELECLFELLKEHVAERLR